MSKTRRQHSAVPAVRWRSELGVWLTVLAVVLNVLANTLYAPAFAAMTGSGSDGVRICTGDGLKTLPVDRADPSGDGWCPACPLCPAHGPAALHAPALTPTALQLPPIRLTGRAVADRRSLPDRPAGPHLPWLSRAPPRA